MITIERTFDYALIRSFMTHPRVYPHIVDDFSPPVDEFKVFESESVYYCLASINSIPAGVFMFVPENGIACEVHTCIGPKLWGRSVEAGKAAIGWVWSNTRLVRINTKVPAYNTLAERLSRNVGMTKYGACPNGVMRDGLLWDVYLYGMSKE